jgi:hypothetical protein
MPPKLISRPRLAPGTALPGFPPFVGALFADADCEVYLMGWEGRTSHILITVRDASPPAPDPGQLADWIAQSGGKDIVAVRQDARAPLAADAYCLRASVTGAWLGEAALPSLTTRELHALLAALAAMAARASRDGLVALPLAPLLWIDGPLHAPRLASVYVRAGGERCGEVPLQIAETFLFAAAGIEAIDARAGDPLWLRSWCQNADAALARILARCLDPTHPIDLEELEAEVRAAAAEFKAGLGEKDRIADRYADASPIYIAHFQHRHP